MLKDIKKGLSIGFGFVLMVGIVGVSYAALSGLKASGGEYLTVAKWDSLVDHAVPSTAVMAFASDICPNGWSEYLPAQGRFIRGIDKTGTLIDPDGKRTIGDIKGDTMQNAQGNFSVNNAYPDLANGVFSIGEENINHWEGGNYYNGINKKINFDLSSQVRTSSETRPKNVALLYCIKN